MITDLPPCRGCMYLDDLDIDWKTPSIGVVYCSCCKDPFEKRFKPWNCPFSPLCKEENLTEGGKDVR